MTSNLHRLFGIYLLASLLAGLANAQAANESEHTIEAQLKASVHNGMTIDEAVTQYIKLEPDNGKEITNTALSIYRGLSKTACAIRAKDGGLRFAVWPDFKACGDRIVRAAIKAGADPTEITSSPAAGLPSTDPEAHDAKPASEKGTHKTFGYALYILHQIFLDTPD